MKASAFDKLQVAQVARAQKRPSYLRPVKKTAGTRPGSGATFLGSRAERCEAKRDTEDSCGALRSPVLPIEEKNDLSCILKQL